MKLYRQRPLCGCEKDGDTWTVGGAKILVTVQASNGVVHVVDKVMLPPQ
ncbi:MAG: fasciclin domain-containing protein [Saprospiraceae bacterium]